MSANGITGVKDYRDVQYIYIYRLNKILGRLACFVADDLRTREVYTRLTSHGHQTFPPCQSDRS